MPLFKPNVGKLKARRNVKGLIKALNYKKDHNVQIFAAMALGEIGDTRAVAPLIAASLALSIFLYAMSLLAHLGKSEMRGLQSRSLWSTRAEIFC